MNFSHCTKMVAEVVRWISSMNFSRFFLWTVAISLLCLGGGLAVLDKVAAATLCMTTAFLLLLLANLDKLDYFKGLGIEAKMRKLDERIHEADALLKNLKELSRASSQITFETLSKMGRWSDPVSRAASLEIAKTLRGVLMEIETEADEIERVMKPWHWVNLVDLSEPIRSIIHQKLSEKVQHWEFEANKFRMPEGENNPERIEADKVREYFVGKRQELSEYWNNDVRGFLIQCESIVKGLKHMECEEIEALLSATADDRKDALYYAKNNKFLSEERWLAGDKFSS